MTLIIAGDRSGVGKTTVTLALLASLRQRFPHQTIQSFKVGPDYIDPMFHRAITRRACRNLDPVLTSEAYVRQCFARHAQGADYAIIEGVMGLFDGAGATETASTAHIAKLLGIPVLLVVDAQRTSRSVAALVHGFRSFDPEVTVAGVVLNRVGSDRHRDLLLAAMASINMPVLGVLRREDAIAIPSRHLGLVPSGELAMTALTARLAHLGQTLFNWEQLLPLAVSKPSPASLRSLASHLSKNPEAPAKVHLAVATDAAFNFYYADNLDLLARQAEVHPWSPLQDPWPADVQGLYLGGGFPEVFAAALAANEPARAALQQSARQGLPIYAECGGLMYLCDTLVDIDGTTHQMAGVIPARVTMGDRLTLGYRQAKARVDTPLMPRGTQVWGHEFHHSQLAAQPPSPAIYDLRQFNGQPLSSEGWHSRTLHASYLHLHWGAMPQMPQRFLQQCAEYARQQQG